MRALQHHPMFTATTGILQSMLSSMEMPDWVFLILHGSEISFRILILPIWPVIKESTPNRFYQQDFFTPPWAMCHLLMNSGTCSAPLILMNLLLMLLIQGCSQNIFQAESHSGSSIPI